MCLGPCVLVFESKDEAQGVCIDPFIIWNKNKGHY